MVTKYQMHKCSAYCRRKKKVNGLFVTKCKFGFPRQEMEKGEIFNVEQCLKTRRKIYALPRSDLEVRVNDYNPLIFLLTKANMDIQFIAESSLALAHYVTGYVTKAEKSSMQELWQEVSSNKNICSRLWSFGVRSLRSKECGMYEASDLLLGEHLYEKSDGVKWVDASLPHKRKRRVKSHLYLKQVGEKDPDSTDIYEDNLIEDIYPKRPTKMDDVCLYDFVKHNTYSGKNDDGKRTFSSRNKPIIPNHAIYDPEKDGQKDSYYYSLLLLFVPFRNEDELMSEGETPEEAFERQVSTNTRLGSHHEQLQLILQAQGKTKQIDEARVQPDENKNDDVDDDDCPQIHGEARNAMQDVHDLQDNRQDSVGLQDRISKLNSDQLRIFSKIRDHLVHQYEHETDRCSCDNLKPLHMFFSGVGGTAFTSSIALPRKNLNS